jgi:thiamine biosynthesis lipoprotein
MTTHVEHVMGMAVSIDVRRGGDDVSIRKGVAKVVRWLHWVDETFSPFKPDSVITRMNAGELSDVEVPDVVMTVLQRCEALKGQTAGYFDVRAGGALDPCGFVKGWAVDAASELLTGAGIQDHCVNAGGDIVVHGRPAQDRPWRIAIAHPMVREAMCAVLELTEGAVATSGIAERGAHVINPHSGRAALDLASVTVTGPDLATTDAYATAALAMGFAAPEWLSSLDGYEALVVDTGGFMWQTPGCPLVAHGTAA